MNTYSFPYDNNANYYLIGNPIIVRMHSTGTIRADHGKIEILNTRNEFIFSKKGSFYMNTCDFSISDCLEDYVNTELVNNSIPAFFDNASKEVILKGYFLLNGATLSTFTKRIRVFTGALSKSLYKRLINRYSNIFDTKFFNRSAPKLLTNRREIHVTKNELAACPFSFYLNNNMPASVLIRLVCDSIITSDLINITGNLSKRFQIANVMLYQKLIDMLSIYSQEQINNTDTYFLVCPRPFLLSQSEVATSSHILRIHTPQDSANSRILLFRNSWGVFEALEVKGEFSQKISRETDPTLRYEYASDSFVEEEDATITHKISFEGETAFMNNERLSLMADFCNSREIYMLHNSVLIKIILTNTDMTFYKDSKEITSLPIEFYIAQQEVDITELYTTIPLGNQFGNNFNANDFSMFIDENYITQPVNVIQLRDAEREERTIIQDNLFQRQSN